MDFIIGGTLAAVVSALARAAGFDRDRSFYPTVAIVIASYYVLFAVVGGSPWLLVPEVAFAAGFVCLAVLGHRKSLWLVVAALVLHGGFDLVHVHLVTNPGVPRWWPGFCLAYDFGTAAFLAWLLQQRRLQGGRAEEAAS